MRWTLARAVTPALERVLGAFDPTWSRGDHERLARRLAGARDGAHALDIAAFTSVKLLHSRAPDLTSAACAALQGAWPFGPGSLAPAARALLAGVRSGACSAADARASLASLPQLLEARRWFLNAGVRAGLGDLFRALLALDTHSDYVGDVAERLLRHVEVKRSDALAVPAPAQETHAERELEKLVWCHALFDAADAFADLRFVNAAMKRLDFHADALAAGAPPSPAHALAYVGAVERQEQSLARLAR